MGFSILYMKTFNLVGSYIISMRIYNKIIGVVFVILTFVYLPVISDKVVKYTLDESKVHEYEKNHQN